MRKKRRQPLHRHVVRHLTNWFVPHKRNDHRPHLVRKHGLALMAGLIVAVQLSANVLMGANARVLGYASDITVADLLAQTNQQRAANGLPALKLDARLNNSATMKANNMFQENYWAHVSPSGIQPWYWFNQAGYHYLYAGENLAKDFDTTSGVMTGWMNSAGHRANILNANYKDVGFSVMNGTLQGGQTTLVVAHYGAESSGGGGTTATPTPKPTVKATIATAAPTPLVTATPAPSPTPEPTPSPAPSPTPTLSPAASASPALLAPSAPVGLSKSFFQPLALLRSLNWGTVISIMLLTVLLTVYVATHFVAWRKQLRHWTKKRYKWLAIGEIILILAMIIGLAISGIGKVG